MTREEAIEELKELLRWYLEEEPMSETVYKREAVSMAISALSENKGEWIPVSDRLPEKKVKDYLACCEDGYVATIMYDNGRWLINGNNVIAWMPLPEPYKAEKGGD